MIAWLFYNPISLPFNSVLWLLPPLCASVAIIYKTVRTNDLRRLWLQILAVLGYVMGGLVVLGAATWIILAWWR